MTSLPTPPPTRKRSIASLAAEVRARRKPARVAGVGGEGGLTRPFYDGLEWGCGARGDSGRPRLMRRWAVKEVGVMCTAGAIIAFIWRGKMLLDGIIGRGTRSEPLTGKAYIEFHSGPKVIKMKYIETPHTSYGRSLVFTPCFISLH